MFFSCTDSLHTPHSPGDKLQPVFTVNYNLRSTFTATDNSQLTFFSCSAPLATTSLLLSTLIHSYWPFRAAIEYYLLITSRFLPVLFRLHPHKWSTNIHLSPNYEHTSSFFCSTRYSTPSCPKLKTLLHAKWDYFLGKTICSLVIIMRLLHNQWWQTIGQG